MKRSFFGDHDDFTDVGDVGDVGDVCDVCDVGNYENTVCTEHELSLKEGEKVFAVMIKITRSPPHATESVRWW